MECCITKKVLFQSDFTAVIFRKTAIVEIGSVKHTGKLLSTYNLSHN